ncbi:MAG: NADH:flavin oxidoreductase, partial [Pseudomonadota bacterium]
GLMAELLRKKGCEVALVTPAPDVSHWTHNTLEQGRIQTRLIELGVEIIPLHSITAVGAGAATVSCVYTERTREIACATFLPVTMRLPVDSLFHQVSARLQNRADADGPAPKTLTRIGDCLAPGTIAAAVWAGHRYARELGEPPVEGVPFRRELPALAAD